MNNNKKNYPIADLHCDMLDYLCNVLNASPQNTNDLGCALPHLINGNVKFQVMAIYSSVEENSPKNLLNQAEKYHQLLMNNSDILSAITDASEFNKTLNTNKIGVMLSIENASGLCNEYEPLSKAFQRFDNLKENFKSILYISLTHHGENRFGGGNNSIVGLKDDGKEILNFLSGKKTAIDLSHPSDALATDILNHIDKNNLDLQVIASHSNFRKIHEHPRNLPDELVSEIIYRKGLIGINFVRAFVHPQNPSMLKEHILYGFQSGASSTLCFGADFFYTKSHPDPSRQPFFFLEHENATKYKGILSSLNSLLSEDEISAIACNNVISFINRLYA